LKRKTDKDKAKEKETMQSRGQRLRNLRESKGISLEEVHQKTKIHPRILKALEEDAVAQMSPAYVKGLLKIYCSFLGVNYNDFIEQRPREGVKEEGIPEAAKIRPRLHLAKPLIDLSLIKKIKLKPLIIVICLSAFAVAAFKLGKTISTYRASRPKKSVAKAVAPKQEAPSVKPIAGKPELGIRAKEDCWLEVKTDGKLIFRNVLKKGNYEEWEAKEKIEFSVGNAGGVDVEVNGKLLPPLGRRGQVIKNIRVTKQGLTVPE
jgi:cytoskeletal protein RodZ